METWKQIIGYEGLYEVSDLGNCRRISRGKKLSANKVDKAKAMLASGGTLKAIGAKLGVSYGTIFQIRHGMTWNGNHSHRVVNPILGSDFYLYFMLCREGKKKRFSAHRVVWEAFNGPIPYRLQINHKNLDRADNRLANIELMTCAENIQHAMKHYQRNGGTHQNGGLYHAQKLALKAKRAAR